MDYFAVWHWRTHTFIWLLSNFATGAFNVRAKYTPNILYAYFEPLNALASVVARSTRGVLSVRTRRDHGPHLYNVSQSVSQ